MKKILVTGASGLLGKKVISNLLLEGKYEITAIDYKNKDTIRFNKKYKSRINIIFGDTTNDIMKDLIKDHDIIIHLSSILPPFANMNKEIPLLNNYNSTKNIVDIMTNYKDKYLIFSSCSSVYNITDNNYYAQTKLQEETLIKKRLKNFTIFRFNQIVSNEKVNIDLNIPLNSEIELITDNDASSSIVLALDKLDSLKGKTYDVSGGINCRTTYRDYINEVFKIKGFKVKYRLFSSKKDVSYLPKDNKLSKLIDYQQESLEDYYNRLRKTTKESSILINKLLSKPYSRVVTK